MQNKRTHCERERKLTELLRRCEITSGKSGKVIASELGVDDPGWSRIKTLQNNFPILKIKRFLKICGTDDLLRWIAEDCGYTIVKNINTQEQKMQDEINKMQDGINFLREHLKNLK